ncbi:MAG: hypothetical protein IH840_15125 [Candidatus Heimdallarchaeota archaeon]|nr:hypothetical protein [Candidatus Heimdallarchaeota archaeon]
MTFIKRFRRAVSPVIAVILLIALTIAAIAIIFTITRDTLDDKNISLLYKNHAVADRDGDELGDLILLDVRNIGTDDAEVSEVILTRNGIAMDSWVMSESSYTVAGPGTTIISLETVSASDAVNFGHEVTITIIGNGFSKIFSSDDITIPDVLSGLAVFFEGVDFSQINLAEMGWVEYQYTNDHSGGGGKGIYVSGPDLILDENDDVLYYVLNDDFKVKNGIISADFVYGDNDGLGIAFRIIDELNYYWVGLTHNHNGPQARHGETGTSGGAANTFGGPFFSSDDGAFEIHKIVNGVDTELGLVYPTTFSIPNIVGMSTAGPYRFIISFNDNTLSFQSAPVGNTLEEIFTVTDSSLPDAGYFGVFSLGCDDSVLEQFTVSA